VIVNDHYVAVLARVLFGNTLSQAAAHPVARCRMECYGAIATQISFHAALP
jgi:hypothetical protein